MVALTTNWPNLHWSNLMRWWCSWLAHLMSARVTHNEERLCAWGLALTSMGSWGCSRKEGAACPGRGPPCHVECQPRRSKARDLDT